jgi:hypothetical protein
MIHHTTFMPIKVIARALNLQSFKAPISFSKK